MLRKRSFRTKAAAERWARKTEAAIDDGQQLQNKERYSVLQILKAYEEGGLGALRNAAGRREHLVWWKARIGRVVAHELTKRQIREQLAGLEAGDTPTGRPAAPATRRRYLATLRAAYSWAVDRELLDWNPARGAARPGVDVEPPGRIRFLDDQERVALLTACDASTDARLGPLVRVAVLTGARQSELMDLTWDGVDFPRGLLSLAVTKAGRAPVTKPRGHRLWPA